MVALLAGLKAVWMVVTMGYLAVHLVDLMVVVMAVVTVVHLDDLMVVVMVGLKAVVMVAT